MRRASMSVACTCLLAIALLPGCGYHTSTHSAHLPDNLRTIASPSFVNQTQTFRIEQMLTGAVVREMTTRTHYQLLHEAEESADATLRGIVLSTSTSPLAYDSKTGRAASVLVTISMRVTLTARDGKVLFENPSYVFHEQYEVSRELSSFFEEDSPAMERLSRDFARTLVSSILEDF